MQNDEKNNPSSLALYRAFTDISKLLRHTSTGIQNTSTRERFSRTDPGESTPKSEISEISALLRSAAEQYRQLEKDARSSIGVELQLSSILSALETGLASAKRPTSGTDPAMAAMANLFGRASAAFTPIIVPLAGRVEAGSIAIYEPYERDFHPASVRTSIGMISGDWVRKTSDGVTGTPDIFLDLEYAHEDPSPEVIVELTWVGRDAITVSGGTSWTPAPLISDGETVGSKVRSLAFPAIDGWVVFPLTIALSNSASVGYDVWMRTSTRAKPGPAPDDDDDDLLFRLPPTPVPIPVPSPTPTGIPTDIFAALDPDRWRQLEDRLGQFVRDTVGAFEGVLSRVDFLKDRTVLRDVSAALRERVRG